MANKEDYYALTECTFYLFIVMLFVAPNINNTVVGGFLSSRSF